jgi:hypothetical protein
MLDSDDNTNIIVKYTWKQVVNIEQCISCNEGDQCVLY